MLETRIAGLLSGWEIGAGNLVEALASSAPTPGGGSAAAAASAMGAALGLMAMAVSLQSKKVEEDKKAVLRAAHARLSILKNELTVCISEDARAYDLFVSARKLPKDSPARAAAMQAAARYAAETPLQTAKISKWAMDELTGLKDCIHAPVMSDLNCALHLLKSGIACAAENVRINLGSIADKNCAEKLEREIASLVC